VAAEPAREVRAQVANDPGLVRAARSAARQDEADLGSQRRPLHFFYSRVGSVARATDRCDRCPTYMNDLRARDHRGRRARGHVLRSTARRPARWSSWQSRRATSSCAARSPTSRCAAHRRPRAADGRRGRGARATAGRAHDRLRAKNASSRRAPSPLPAPRPGSNRRPSPWQRVSLAFTNLPYPPRISKNL